MGPHGELVLSAAWDRMPPHGELVLSACITNPPILAMKSCKIRRCRGRQPGPSALSKQWGNANGYQWDINEVTQMGKRRGNFGSDEDLKAKGVCDLHGLRNDRAMAKTTATSVSIWPGRSVWPGGSVWPGRSVWVPNPYTIPSLTCTSSMGGGAPRGEYATKWQPNSADYNAHPLTYASGPA